MTIKISTGLRDFFMNATATGGSFADAFESAGRIVFYDGTVPETADAAVTGNVLCVIGNSAGGAAYGSLATITFEASSGGVMLKTASETWSGLIIASGTATFFRIVTTADTSGAPSYGVGLSTTAKRVQGTIAQAGADGNLSNTALVANGSNVQAIDYFAVTIPAS